MASPYVTVFQVTQRSPDLWFACVGLVPLIIGAVVIWGKRRFKCAQPHWLFAVFSCSFGVLWIGVVGTTTASSDLTAFTAYQKGDYQTVEGLVSDFHPMPYEGHQEECFSVQNQRFCYSDYMITPGFHNATSHGGPIHEGLPVRIAYQDGNILRLEIPQDQVQTPAQAAVVKANGERQWEQRSEADPIQRQMTTAFLFAGMCWTIWWNLQWKQAMRFWVKPPYGPWVQYLFRTFFALSFCGAVFQFVHELIVHPLTRQTVGPVVITAAIMCAVIAAMTTVVLWMANRRDRKAVGAMSQS